MLTRFQASIVNLVTDTLTAEIAAGLRADRLPVIVLKGASIREWLYEEHEERHSGDVDLLVPPSEREGVNARLAALGLLSVGPSRVGRGRSSEWLWQEPKSGVIVELHESLSGVGVDAETAWRVLSEHTEQMSIAGEPVEVLDLPRRALHLALHAAHHGPPYPRPIADLERGIGGCSGADVARSRGHCTATRRRPGSRGRAAAGRVRTRARRRTRARERGHVAPRRRFAGRRRTAGCGRNGLVARGSRHACEARLRRAGDRAAAERDPRLEPAGAAKRGRPCPHVRVPAVWLARHAVPAAAAVRRAGREAKTNGDRESRATHGIAADAADEPWLALRMLGWSWCCPCSSAPFRCGRSRGGCGRPATVRAGPSASNRSFA